jgi:hypothetical protein
MRIYETTTKINSVIEKLLGIMETKNIPVCVIDDCESSILELHKLNEEILKECIEQTKKN